MRRCLTIAADKEIQRTARRIATQLLAHQRRETIETFAHSTGAV